MIEGMVSLCRLLMWIDVWTYVCAWVQAMCECSTAQAGELGRCFSAAYFCPCTTGYPPCQTFVCKVDVHIKTESPYGLWHHGYFYGQVLLPASTTASLLVVAKAHKCLEGFLLVCLKQCSLRYKGSDAACTFD